LVVGDIINVVVVDAKLLLLLWWSEVQCKSWQQLRLNYVRLPLTTWQPLRLTLGDLFEQISIVTNTSAINNDNFAVAQQPI
jgi:hypothetical protein